MIRDGRGTHSLLVGTRIASGALCVVAACAIAGTRAEAQYGMGALGRQRPIEFMVGGGVSVPASDARDAFENGVNGSAAIVFHSGVLPLTLRAGFGFQRWDLKPSPTAADGSGQLLGWLLNAGYEAPLGLVRPYVEVGGGVYTLRVKADLIGISSGSAGSPTANWEDTQTKLGVNGGAGLKIGRGRVQAFVEGRIDNMHTDRDLFDMKSVRAMPVTIGISF